MLARTSLNITDINHSRPRMNAGIKKRYEFIAFAEKGRMIGG